LLPAVAVADPAEEGAAHRPHHEAGGEGAEGGEGGGGGGVGREEVGADLGGEEAEEGEVVPLEHVADHAGGDPAPDGGDGAELLGVGEAGDDLREGQDGGHRDRRSREGREDTDWRGGSPGGARRPPSRPACMWKKRK